MIRSIGATRELDEGVVDARELALAELAQLAAHLCEAALAVITTLDGADVWGWSSGPLGAAARGRGEALARELAGEDVLIVADVQSSARGAESPAVAGPPPLRFVAALRILGDTGTPIGTLCVADVRAHDLSAEHRMALRLIARQAGHVIEQPPAPRAPQPSAADELADFVDNAPVGLHSLDADGRFRWLNRTELRWVGLTREEVVGRMRLHDLIATDSLDAFRADFARLATGQAITVETALQRRDGAIVPVVIAANALRDEDSGDLRSRAVVVERSAMPEPARVEAARVARSLDQLRLALGAGNVVVWHWDVLTDALIWHGPLGRIFGVAEASLEPTSEAAARWVHPDDRLGVGEAIDRARRTRSTLQHTFRIIRADGTVRWLWARGDLRYDADGEVVSMSGVLRDVTDEPTDRRALAASERRLTAILEAMSDAFVAVDRDLRYAYVNRRAAQLLGRVAAELIGKHLWADTPDHDVAGFRDAVEHARADGVATELEHAVAGRWRHCRIYPAPDGGLSIFFTDITEQRATRESQGQANRQLRSLSERLIAVREEEAARLAREIHDGLGQTLTALKLDLAWLGARPQGDTHDLSVTRKLRDMTALVDDLFAAIRRMASELRPRMLEDLGLAAAIEWQVGDFAARSHLVCELDLAGEELTVPKPVAIALYRVLQEALANVVHHARATRVAVRLRKDDDHAVLELTDDGRGITPEEVAAPSSIGILGMRERMALVGGTLEVRGGPGHGTTIVARAPLG